MKQFIEEHKFANDMLLLELTRLSTKNLFFSTVTH